MNAGINLSGDLVTRNTAGYPEGFRGQVRWLFGYAKEKDFDYVALEEATKIDGTTLHQCFKGSAIQNLLDADDLEQRISQYRKVVERREEMERLPFIETSVYAYIAKLADDVLAMQTIGVVYGQSQIGKTRCAKEYARRNNHGQTVYALTPAGGTKVSFLKAIAEGCQITSNLNFDTLLRRICVHLNESRLLIFDEIHELFETYSMRVAKQCLSLLRQIQERTGCGLMLMGTEVFRTELERGDFTQSMKQLRRRGIWELQLDDTPSWSDIKLMFRHYKLPEPKDDVREIVEWIARENGFGKLSKFLERASGSRKKGERLTWNHFTRIIDMADRIKETENERKERERREQKKKGNDEK